MTPYLKQWLLASALLPTALCAQVAVDRSKYPDYSDKVNPDPSLMQVKRSSTRATTTRPDHVNNADTKYFLLSSRHLPSRRFVRLSLAHLLYVLTRVELVPRLRRKER